MAWYNDVFKAAKETYDEYKGLIDLGGSAGKAYLDYKDQKRRNELDEQGYRDYMLEKESAGREAQLAVDMNLTPMTVTGVPTSKADVTSFQAVARGGIIGLKNGGAPNAGIAALRKKAPGVVKRMGYNEGSGKNGVMQIIDKIRNNNYKRQLGETDQGDLNERTTVIETNNAFKEPFRAIAEPGESKNRSILNALISDGMEGMEEKMDEASKDKMILSLIKEMRETGEMEKDEYNMYMESYLTSEMQKGGIAGLRNGGRPGYMDGEGPVMDGTVTSDAEGVKSKVSNELKGQIEGNQIAEQAYNEIMEKFMDKFPGIATGEETLEEMVAMLQAEGVMDYGNEMGILGLDRSMDMITPESAGRSAQRIMRGDTRFGSPEFNMGGRVKYANGSDGILDLGGREKDYRFNGGFVPIGEYEKKDDVPARLSKNEFVFTADAVRAAGGGSINKGAQKMYNTMKTLEAQPTAKRMTA